MPKVTLQCCFQFNLLSTEEYGGIGLHSGWGRKGEIGQSKSRHQTPSLKRPSINPPAEKRQHVTINAPRNPYITDNTNVPINPYVSVPPNCCYPHFLPLLHRYKLQCTTYLELIPMNVRTKMPSLPTFPPCEDDDYEDYNDADKDAVDAMPF